MGFYSDHDPGIQERESDAAVPFCATAPLRVLDTMRSPASDRRWSEDERLSANAQTRVELKTARWRARREIDELTADGPAPIRFHRQVPF
jgi:hypothetical protein